MASSVTRETFINAVRDALGFDRGGIDAFLKAINPATSAEDTAKASRPSSTGSADGDARDHHGGGSLDQPATESRRTVGAVVRDGTLRHYDEDDLLIVVADDPAACQRFLDNPRRDLSLADAYPEDEFVRWATREECERHGIPFVDRTTPAPVAPDREGLANALRVAWWGREDDKTTWGATPCDARSDWLRTADAAIAYFAKLGGAK